MANGSGGIKKNASFNTLLYYSGKEAPLTSLRAAVLVLCSFVDTALGTLGTAQGAAEQQLFLQEVHLQSLHLQELAQVQGPPVEQELWGFISSRAPA